MAHGNPRPEIQPLASLAGSCDLAAKAVFPGIITVLLMVLTQASLHLPEQAALLPSVALACVWFWSLFRPDTMPPPLVFMVGLLLDLLGSLPLGVGVFMLLVVQVVALALRRPLCRRGWLWIWVAFAGVAGCASLAMWLLVMLLTVRLLPSYPAVFTACLASVLFPMLAVPLAAVDRLLAPSEQV